MRLTRKDKKRVIRLLADALKPWPMATVHGALPEPRRYPCERFLLSYSLHCEFPPEVDNSYPLADKLPHSFESDRMSLVVFPPKNQGEATIKALLRPYVGKLDDEIRRFLSDAGFHSFGSYWDEPGETDHIALVYPLEPFGLDEEFDKNALKYGRWMTAAEKSEFEATEGREPFSDEAWIPLKYPGFNMLRTAKYGTQ